MVGTETRGIVARPVRRPFAELVSPADPAWERAAEVAVRLLPTPLEAQPSAYVQAAWAGRPRGGIRELGVRSITSAGALLIRLSWSAPRPSRGVTDVDAFADACAVLFGDEDADLATMGSPEHRVTGWQWQSGRDRLFWFSARGLGTVERAERHDLVARSQHVDGSWRVVFGAPLDGAGGPAIDGPAARIAFAVWSGAARERAGLKSYSPEWLEFRLGGRAR
jgi:DMSO reductase family type II enzyme heme b subunit